MVTWADIVGVVISILSFIATSILTIYIICQNTKLNNKQNELKERIAQKDTEMANRNLKQLQIEKREQVFNLVFEIYDYCELIGIIFDKNKTYKQYSNFFEDVHNLKQNIFESYNVKLLVGENYVGKHVAPTIAKIRKLFFEMQEKISLFAVGYLLTDKEKTDVCNNMSDIKELCLEILKTKFYITSILEEELRI